MAALRGTLPLALAAGALLLAPPASAAHANASNAGGRAAGPSSAARPVVASLRVPQAVPAGVPPAVTLRVAEAATVSVYVEVRVSDLASGRTVLSARLGWVSTGRSVVVRWPAGAALGVGSYHVRVLVHDARGASVLRSPAFRGVATLIVTPAAAGLAPVPAAPAAAPAGVPSPAALATAGAVFPVAGPHTFGGPENRFGAPREGHTHEGQDVLAAEGTPVVAPLAGTITTTAFQEGGAGDYAVEHTAVGLDLMFAHCQAGSLAVVAGRSVAAGQQLCRVGQTGDATAPHLHLEMWVGGWWAPGGYPIDPLPYLEAWEAFPVA
jgi:murein DD-endopeptidase MepM/ murein hydrolase activator NlpD